MYVVGISVVFFLISVANSDNTEVFTTHDSTCICNSFTNGCTCVLEWNNFVSEYKDVNEIITCNRHYCVLSDESSVLRCSGRVFSSMAGNLEFNPLHLNGTASVEANVLPVGSLFMGYNLITEYFEVNARTHYPLGVESMRCNGPYGTCVQVVGSDAPECFGIPGDVVFYDEIMSFFVGAGVQSSAAFPLLLGVHYFFRKRPGALYGVSTFAVHPLCFIGAFALVNYGIHAFFVKVYTYVIGCAAGAVVSGLLVRGIMACRFKAGAVGLDDREQSAGLIGGETETETETEIELGAT